MGLEALPSPCIDCGGSGDRFSHLLHCAYLEGHREVLAWMVAGAQQAAEPRLSPSELKGRLCP